MSSDRKKGEFVHIGPVLDRLLKQCKGIGGDDLERIRQVWDRVVGEPIRRNARPAAINKTTLLVHVTSSPWLHQLQFLKKDILLRLNSDLTTIALEDLLFKIGPV